ncbi:MAG: tetratricopeptide repeat protein [Tannerella sp.]|jgi:TolA-binding protein|nr:tetratricopeptide repeat protein [Tannerella sp.]
MKKILVLLCLTLGCHGALGQRSRQFESPERLFLEGKDFFDLKNYPGCSDKLDAFKKQPSADSDLIQEADYMLAFIAFEQGRKDAGKVLEQYLETYPDTRHRDEICFLLGSVHFAEAAWQTALYWLNESDIDRLSPTQSEDYLFRMAYSLLQLNSLKAAQPHFLRLRQTGTTYREAASYYLAYIDYAQGNYKNALSEFTELKNRPLYREQCLYYMTQIQFLQNQYGKAIASGEELLEAYPNSSNNTEIYRILGNAYYHQGDQDKALARLSEYAESAETPLRGDLYLLGVCQYNKKNYKKAVQAFSETIKEQDALTQNAFLYLGQCYLNMNDKNNARMAFEWAATTAYDKQVQETAMYNYALLIHETSFSGFGESVKIFEDFLNDFPESRYADKVNDHLVEVYLTTKNYESALASMDKIRQPGVKIQAARQNVLFQLGVQAFTGQETEQAIDCFDRALAMNKQDVNAYGNSFFWRGESYYRLNEFDKAASDFRSFLNNTRDRSDEMYAMAYYNLGYSYFKQKRYESALPAFRQYVDLEKHISDASYADAYNRIGDCQFYNRQFAAAEESYSKAASLQPSSGDYALYQRGFVLGLQKDYQGKIVMMDRLIREYPESSYADDALFEKGHSCVLLENTEMAAEAFHQLIAEYPQGTLARKAGLQLGLLYFNSDRPEMAIDEYKKVISHYPGSEEAKIALQDLKSVYVDMNDVASYAAYVNSLGGNVRLEVNEQDSLTYFAAEKLFMRGDNAGARRSLRNYLNDFPRGAFSVHANYYLAQIAFSQKEYPEALQRYGAVLAGGETKFREEALARKAEIEYLEKDYAAAMKSFKQLQAIAESGENREAAKLGVMRCAQFTGQQAEALQAANELLKSAKLSPEIETEARYLRAKSYIALNEKQKAEADLAVLSKNTRTVYGAEAKYLLAQSFFDRNEVDRAEKEVADFISKGTPHQYWLARAFILQADVYIRKGDDFLARQYLTSLKKNYKGKDEIAGMIEQRLGKLNQ